MANVSHVASNVCGCGAAKSPGRWRCDECLRAYYRERARQRRAKMAAARPAKPPQRAKPRAKVARPRPEPRRKPSASVQDRSSAACTREAAPAPASMSVVAGSARPSRATAAAQRKPATRRPRETVSTVVCSRPGCGKFVPTLALSESPPYCSRPCAIYDRPAARALCPAVFTTQDGRSLLPR